MARFRRFGRRRRRRRFGRRGRKGQMAIHPSHQFADQLGGWARNKTPGHKNHVPAGFWLNSREINVDAGATLTTLLTFQLNQIPNFTNMLRTWQRYRIQSATVFLSLARDVPSDVSNPRQFPSVFLASFKQDVDGTGGTVPIQDARTIVGCEYKEFSNANNVLRKKIYKPVARWVVEQALGSGTPSRESAGAYNQVIQCTNDGFSIPHYGFVSTIINHDAAQNVPIRVQIHLQVLFMGLKYNSTGDVSSVVDADRVELFPQTRVCDVPDGQVSKKMYSRSRG